MKIGAEEKSIKLHGDFSSNEYTKSQSRTVTCSLGSVLTLDLFFDTKLINLLHSVLSHPGTDDGYRIDFQP